MTNRYGYYSVEVLIAIYLFSYTSLSLFKYQWHIQKINHCMQSEWYALSTIDNLSEKFIAGQKELDPLLLEKIQKRLHHARIEYTRSTLMIRWEEECHGKSRHKTLKRYLSV